MSFFSNDPYAQFSLFVAVMTLFILFIFVYLNKIALQKVQQEKSKQLSIDVDTLKNSLREELIREYEKDHSVKLSDMKSDFHKKKTQITSLIYRIRNMLSTMNSESIVKDLSTTLTTYFPAASLIILLRDPSNSDRLLFACSKGEGIPEFDSIQIDDLPVVRYAMGKGTILSINDPNLDIQKINNTGLPINVLLTIPLMTVAEGQMVSKGVVLILDLISEPDKDDITLVSTLSTLAGGALNNAADLASSRKLNEEQLREKKKLTQLFSKYVSPNVVESLVESGHEYNLGGQEAKVAIFFADIRNFTTLSEKLSPKEVVSLLNEYFHAMNEIIFRWKGTLDKYIGDEIMALFGAPVEAMDDCYRAVACGMEMQTKLTELNSRWEKEEKPTLSIGIGINYGTVVAGNIGSEQRMEYTVIGDGVNVASRICGLAKPGQVLITDHVFMEIIEMVDVTKLQDVKVKGREESVMIYDVKKCI